MKGQTPALAGFNGIMFPPSKGFFFDDSILYTGNVGIENNNRQKRYHEEMHQAAKNATKRINKEDEEIIDKRISRAEEDGDRAFKHAKESVGKHGDSHALNRQYQKWTDVEEVEEGRYFRSYENRSERVKEVWKKLGESWEVEEITEKTK